MHRLASLVIVVPLTVGCSETTSIPVSRTLKVVSIDGATAKVATHYCTPATLSTEQWVAVGDAMLTVVRDGTFELDASSAVGSSQFHMNGAAKVYDVQTAIGGGNGLAGSVVTSGDGSQTLLFERATSMGANPRDYSGRMSGDSAIITTSMTCPTPTAPDSGHVFVLVLR